MSRSVLIAFLAGVIVGQRLTIWQIRRKIMAKKRSKPSDKVSPEKARQILRDDSAQGHKLTPKQKRMFGAAAGRKPKQRGR